MMSMLRICNIHRLLLLAGILSCSVLAYAGNGGGQVRAIAVLDGSRHQIKVDSFRTVIDSTFFNPANIGNLDSSYAVQNQVSLMINEASTLYLRSKFTATVQLRISYSTGKTSRDTASIIRSFTISYDSSGNYPARSSFTFNGGRQVTVRVLSVDLHGAAWDLTSVLVIENRLTANPVFHFQCSNSVSNITITPAGNSNADELPVSWSAIPGADQYDLEWAFIDTSALTDGRYGSTLTPELIFRNNATRVSITGSAYNIPLIYEDTGTLFIRVRPVQLRNGYAVVAGNWSTDAPVPVMGRYTFLGHARRMNWQSNISFAEEGKRKVVVQYFDGSLRSRQTVTKDNTTNTTIVGETYYDYQGRPAIQVMPSPTLSNIIQYTAGFNVGVNGVAYSQSNYDTLPYASAFCGIHADSMSNSAGASQYYSSHNPQAQNGMNQFIPDAQDYPFTETEYMPDNTGRISRQGGVGPNHQLGTGHETKYYYGTPDQRELDALFGLEVGDRSHYFKNMVRDANGQYSVSYVDMHGRTIATALAGSPPSGMAALPSNTTAKITETLADSNSVSFQGQSMVSQKSLVVPLGDTYQFNYNLTPAIFSELNCQQQTICYTCKYDLEISISDNCNNQLLGRNGQQFDTVIHNFSVDSTNTCTPHNRGLGFSLFLQEGSYVITKKLTPNKDAYNFYRDSVYLKNNTCISVQQFINQQKAIAVAANPQCAPTCAACKSAVGDWPSFWNNYIQQGGLTPADTAAFRQEAMTAYQNALTACSSLCPNTIALDDEIQKAMLQDMTPPFGQYADTTLAAGADKYSIFYIKPGDTTNYLPLFKLSSIQYLDINGNPDSVYSQESDIKVDPNSMTTSQFVQNFRPSWAKALLPYHPEYCKLLALQAQHASNLWDRQMEAVDDFQTALSSGYLNPTGNNSIAPFHVEPGNIDPLSGASGTIKSLLEAKLTGYQPAQGNNPTLSMWALACAMVKCNPGSSGSSCIATYANINNDFTGNMCEGDLDMAWKNFREMYLGAKQLILNQQLISNPAGCSPMNSRAYSKVPSSEDLYTAKHQPEFSDVKTSSNRTDLQDFNNVNGPTSATNLQNQRMQSIENFYTDNCNAYATQWAQQLSPCTVYTPAAIQQVLIPALTALCRKACDLDHPYGASTLPPGMTYTPAWATTPCSSFQDIINQFNSINHVTDALNCNAEVITSPYPYGNQPVYSTKPVYSRPSDCECNLINDLYNRYQVAPLGTTSFSAYLLKAQQITMSDADLSTLLTMCRNTTNSASCKNLPRPIYLPAAMQCYSGAACVPCHIVDSLYGAYRSSYPTNLPSITSDADTAQARKNQIFQNYMNNRLGFNKQTWEYLQFMDSCSRSDTSTTTSCLPKTIGNVFQSNGTDHINDIQATPDGGYIIAGNSTAGGLGGLDAYIAHADRAGNIQWARVYGGTRNDEFRRIKPTSDNGYVAVGVTRSGRHSQGDMYVVKTDYKGDTLWTRVIGFGTGAGENGFDIIQTHDGGYAVLGHHDYQPGSVNLMLARLDSTGAINWIKQFGTSSSDDAASVLETQDTLLVSGISWASGHYTGDLFKIDSRTGIVKNAWIYENGGSAPNSHDSSLWFSYVYPQNNGYLISLQSVRGYGLYGGQLAAAFIRNDGTPQWYTRFATPPGAAVAVNTCGMIPTQDGGYLVAETDTSNPNIFWQKMSSSNTPQWGVQTTLPGTQLFGGVSQNGDGSYTMTGTNNGHVMVLNLSSQGKTGCYDANTSIATFPLQIHMVSNSLPDVDSILPAPVSDTSLGQAFISYSASPIQCQGMGTCYTNYNPPYLCGKALPVFPPVGTDSTTTCSDSTFFSVSKGTELYKSYADSLTGDFEQRYNKICLSAYKYERFTVTHNQNEYHYTLYYYDQAGNLLKTVPPAGVVKMTDTVWMNRVDSARAAGSALIASLVPAHTLVTMYRYNSLNQVIIQQTPDGGKSNFWYDRLGRLAVSQNAKQQLTSQYSYTRYDTIGRIIQVGQLASSTPITDTISRVDATLQQWLSSAAATANQITVTTYDTANTLISDELAPVNLRNRVSWTGLFNTAGDLANGSPNAAAATYYSYDVLGNVDTLVQDYGSSLITDVQNPMNTTKNRFKKVVYDFDLVSGKVNRVAYQAGQRDAFYHTYYYDAENRITNVQSSLDSINWDNDAWYSYYAHGPLSRTVLGQQQVQGLNYAYTLQGWMKAINPAPYTGGAFTLRPDSAGNIVAASAYNILLNYYNGDYTPVSGAPGPDNGISGALSGGTGGSGNGAAGDYRPLYNGNISSMGVNIRKINNPLLYNYQYDQLNRLIRMDAWNKTSTGSDWSGITRIQDFQERVAYDPNGNILQYKRNGNTLAGQPLGMDSLNYFYVAGTNKLDHITDSVPSGNYATDIDKQAAGNYGYDSIGELVSDSASNIGNISWTVYGKIAGITKKDGTTISYTYDPGGHRISKKVVSGGNTITTWYVRDAQGNVLSVYTYGDPAVKGMDLTQTELHVYGSSRLGIWNVQRDMQHLPNPDTVTIPLLGIADSITFTRGNKFFELTNHLGNVLATISDKRYGVSTDDSTVNYFIPEIVSANDYYPFGSLQPGRSYTENSSGSYRYGFNGKEQDPEVKGTGNQYDYGFRIYDPRIGRFLSVDPLRARYPWNSTYAFAENDVVRAIDLDGAEHKIVIHWIDKKYEDGALHIAKTSVSINKDESFDGWGQPSTANKSSGSVFALTETYYYMMGENKLYKGKDLLENANVNSVNPPPSAQYDYRPNVMEDKAADDEKWAGWNPLKWARLVMRDAAAPDNAQTVDDVNMGMLAFSSVVGAPGMLRGMLKAEGVAVDGANAAATSDEAGVGAMRRMEYEPAPYHGTKDNAIKSKAPTNGQDALDMSVQVKETSPRRIGIDYEKKEFVVFDKTGGNKYHGHVRSWEDLHVDMQNALKKAGMVDNKGKILTGN